MCKDIHDQKTNGMGESHIYHLKYTAVGYTGKWIKLVPTMNDKRIPIHCVTSHWNVEGTWGDQGKDGQTNMHEEGTSLEWLICCCLLLLLSCLFWRCSGLAGFKRLLSFLTDQTVFFHKSAGSSLTKRRVLGVAVFCMRMYRPGRRMSSVKLSCNLFWIITFVDSAVGTTHTALSCHIYIRPCFRSVYSWSISVMVLWRLSLLRTAASTEFASLTVLSSITVSGLLLSKVRSVVTDQSQCMSSATPIVPHICYIVLVLPVIVYIWVTFFFAVQCWLVDCDNGSNHAELCMACIVSAFWFLP